MALGSGLTVERREAPHPCVTGVQRAFARRAADPLVRQGASPAPGASRRSMSLVREGDGKRDRAWPGRPNIKPPGGVALAV